MRVGVQGFQADRLREAREARGITSLVSLAELIGVNTSTVSRWERGESAPSADMLVELAEKLKLRPSYFLRSPYSHGEASVFFRSLAAARKYDLARQRARLQWLQEISIILQHYVTLPAIDLPDVLAGASYAQLRKEDFENIARSLRQHWKLGDQPITDMVGLLEKVGFVVGVDEVGTSALDGLCHWSAQDNRPYILLANDKMSFFRRQMDAAHEMAHALLHRNVKPDELRRDFKLIEEQAFALASAFLMPAERFALEVGQCPTLPNLLAIKDRQRVSIKAMIRRCGSLGITSDDDLRQMYKYYSAKGWTREEPLDRMVALSKPKLLAQSLELIVSSGTRAKEELLANEFTFSARDIEVLLDLNEGWFGKPSADIVTLKQATLSSSRLSVGDAQIIDFSKSRKTAQTGGTD